MASISLCMIAKDEEKYIESAISSVLGAVDDAIVADTGSKDNTKKLAEELGAKVIDVKWQDDFSKARNESIKHAAGDWILILDADEAIAEPDLEKLRKLADDSETDAYIFTQQTYTNDSKLKDWTPVKKSTKETKCYSGWVPAQIIRMFRNNRGIAFEGEVHETVLPSIEKIKGKVRPSKIPIHHYGMERSDRKQGKAELYEKLGKAKIKKGDAKAHYELGKQLVQNRQYEKAIESFAQAIKARPDYADAYADLGTLFLNLGRAAEAKKFLSKAVNLNTQSCDAFNNLGVIYGKLGKHEDAILLFMKAIELKQDYAAAYKNLGLTLDKLDRKEEAALCFATAIKLNPKYKDEIEFS